MPCPDSFFFQAEDGIRDTSVTGVQTCALPICVRAAESAAYAPEHQRRVRRRRRARRSEERRVGKECRKRAVPTPPKLMYMQKTLRVWDRLRAVVPIL